MEKTRVPKGEKYWYIGVHNGMISVFVTIDYHSLYVRDIDIQNDFNFKYGNYFYTQEEAESMARKLRAVLKGADVIEMPSEEEVKQELSYRKRMLGEEFTTDNAFGFRFGVEWIKSKCIR